MSDDNQNEEKVQVLEEDKHLLLDHDYDGIKELNHPLPMWWLITFYGAIIFSIPYWIYYHHMDGPSLMDNHKENMTQVNEARAEYAKKQGGFNVEAYNSFVASMGENKSGRKTYKRKCASCHGKLGEGGIGPNLTDNYWLNGNGSAETVYHVIDKGVVEKGMQAWGESLGKEKMLAVTAYVMGLKGTAPENAKEPQGELYQ